MLAVGSFHELPTGFAVQAEITHEPGNPAHTVAASLRRQFRLNTWRTVTLLILVVDVLNQQFEVTIFGFSC